jgi:hypothetical protein
VSAIWFGIVIACVAFPGERTASTTLEISEVTEPALAISPDGSTLYFSLLGDLVAVPSSGGEARQLTSGPAFDGWPVTSDDGKSLFFVSDREGFSAEVFRLELASGAITRLTDLRKELAEIAIARDGSTLFAVDRSRFSSMSVQAALAAGPEAGPFKLPGSARWPTALSDGGVALREARRASSWLAAARAPRSTSCRRIGTSCGRESMPSPAAPCSARAAPRAATWTAEEVVIVDPEKRRRALARAAQARASGAAAMPPRVRTTTDGCSSRGPARSGSSIPPRARPATSSGTSGSRSRSLAAAEGEHTARAAARADRAAGDRRRPPVTRWFDGRLQTAR